MAELLEKGFTSYLRKSSKRPERPQTDATKEVFGKHVAEQHVEDAGAIPSTAKDGSTSGGSTEAKIEALWKAVSKPGSPSHGEEPLKAPANRKGSATESGTLSAAGDAPASPGRGRGSAKSPASSLKREGSRSLSPPKRSKARSTSTTAPTVLADPDTVKRPPVKGTLWSPNAEPQRSRPADRAHAGSAHRARLHNQPARSPRTYQPPPGGGGGPPAYGPPGEDTTSFMIKQPETKPISQEQLVAEVKGIYAGLVMVESKCIEVDNAQNAQTDIAGHKLNNDQWQALIALHRTLLHEHHDFFLASQHPSAAPALRRLASKYAMPARMWRHGIHSFLELLRHRLPASLEHMLTFIYIAYSMMALLYETVPAFEDTWIECLGDLGRYRMAIEDDDIRHREVWTDVSRHWYSMASDNAPTTGRLYHHLAILARPNGFQQLFFYSKSLCVPIQFESARESIMTLLDPIMVLTSSQSSKLSSTEIEFIRCHGILFSKKYPEKFETAANEFIKTLDGWLALNPKKVPEPCTYIGISACCAIAGYGDEKNPIFRALKNPRPEESVDQPMTNSEEPEEITKETMQALELANRTHEVILQRFGDPYILSYLHVTLVFIYHLTFLPETIDIVAQDYPWKLTALMLNTLLDTYQESQAFSRIEGESFPESEKTDSRRLLPEDYALRGLLWAERYHPDGLFGNDKREPDERYMEVPSMYEERKERVLYLGCRIAAQGGKWLRYNSTAHRFSVAPEFDIELDGLSPGELPRADKDMGELPDAAPEAPVSMAP